MTITEDREALAAELEAQKAPVVTSLVLPAEFALRAFRAALVAASKDYARPILAAVLVTVSGGVAEVVATDSYRLVTVQFKAPDSPDGKILVSRDAVATLAKAYSKSAVAKLDIGAVLVIRAQDRASDSVEIVHPTGTIVAADGHVRGTYPDYRQLIPTGEATGTPLVAYNPAFLADLGKVAAEVAKDSTAPVRQEVWDSLKPSRFTIRAFNGDLETVYLLMPVRLS